LDNPLKSREDLEALALSLVDAVRAFPSRDRAGFDLGVSRAFYGEAATDLETFSRTLWAAAPLCASGRLEGGWIVTALERGTDPGNSAYWGDIGDGDSRMVEMTAIAFALITAPGAVWEPMSPESRIRLVTWLSQINEREIGCNNWRYFRVFVNEALRSLDQPFDEEREEQDLQDIESLYLGEGWYADGDAGTLDYYNAFAFHFYGLLYAKWAEKRDPARAERFRSRAVEFAGSFIHWWDVDGSSIPYGRSLVYRFGMAAFWAAAAYTKLPGLSEGQLKGLLMRHLRWWFRQPILNAQGVLNLGYAYANRNMVEMYNAPGSPMWALKSFVLLLLPEADGFWSAEEAPMPELSLKPVPLPDGKKVLGRSTSGHAWLLSAGHNMPWQGRAFFDKYSRFAYSSRFGFSVSIESTCPQAMAPDSSLIVSLDGKTWFGRRETTDYTSGDDWVASTWSPCPGVSIHTRLTVTAEGHRRDHRIETSQSLELVEGGFAMPRPEEAVEHLERNPVNGLYIHTESSVAELRTPDGFSGIRDLVPLSGRCASIVTPWAGTHLLFPATLIPVLQGRLEPGMYEWSCEVYADRRCQGLVTTGMDG
jgi:hypothetical protein